MTQTLSAEQSLPIAETLFDEGISVICILPVDLGEHSGGDPLEDFFEEVAKNLHSDWFRRLGLSPHTVEALRRYDGDESAIAEILHDLGGYIVLLDAEIYEEHSRNEEGEITYRWMGTKIQQPLWLGELTQLFQRLEELLNSTEFRAVIRRHGQ